MVICHKPRSPWRPVPAIEARGSEHSAQQQSLSGSTESGRRRSGRRVRSAGRRRHLLGWQLCFPLCAAPATTARAPAGQHSQGLFCTVFASTASGSAWKQRLRLAWRIRIEHATKVVSLPARRRLVPGLRSPCQKFASIPRMLRHHRSEAAHARRAQAHPLRGALRRRRQALQPARERPHAPVAVLAARSSSGSTT